MFGNLVEDRRRIGFENTGRKDEVFALRDPLAPTLPSAGDKSRRCGERVVPEGKINRARMGGLAPAVNHAVVDHPADPGDESHAGTARLRETHALLDVEFQEGRDRLRVDDGRSRRKARHVVALRRQAFGKGRRVRRPAAAEIRFRKFPHHRAGANEALLLAAKRRHDDVARGRDAPRLQIPHDEKRRGDAREPVEVAAVQDAVGVTAAKEAGQRPVAPGKAHQKIARGVAGSFQSERAAFLF